MAWAGHAHVVNTKTISIAGTCLVPIDPALLKQCPLGEDVDVSAERDALVIRPVRRQPRQGWAEALAAVPDHELARDQADLAAFRETPHDWDRKDWAFSSFSLFHCPFQRFSISAFSLVALQPSQIAFCA
jgi:antitoxin component of MazEF toxin-antitoxin module